MGSKWTLVAVKVQSKHKREERRPQWELLPSRVWRWPTPKQVNDIREVNGSRCHLKVDMLGFPNQLDLESGTKRNIKEGGQAFSLSTGEVCWDISVMIRILTLETWNLRFFTGTLMAILTQQLDVHFFTVPKEGLWWIYIKKSKSQIYWFELKRSLNAWNMYKRRESRIGLLPAIYLQSWWISTSWHDKLP